MLYVNFKCFTTREKRIQQEQKMQNGNIMKRALLFESRAHVKWSF